jgi:UDP:flavonoid glycosyltransferase YjiC (YdhE family)
MPRIVLACWGSFGDVFPALGVALGLKARGHDPVLATLPPYQELIESQGIGFRPLRPTVTEDDYALLARAMDRKRGPEVIFREMLLPAVRDQYEDLREAAAGADLLVTHPAVLAGPIVAEKLGRPWVSTVLAPLSFFSAYDPPVLPQLPPLVRFMRLGPWAARLCFRVARATVRRWCEPIRSLRLELGLPPGRNPIFEDQFSPHLTLALFSPLLAQPQPDWPPNTELAGFIPYNGTAQLSEGVEEFLAAGEPPVVFTLGSSAVGIPGTFYHESATAAARLGLRAILLVGKNPANRPREPLRKDLLLVESAPHAQLFPRAAAIVHQAGAGTLGQSLRAGRPMLIAPFAHDQYDNADRAVRLGVARVLYPHRYTADRAAAHLDVLLRSADYQARAQAVGQEARLEDGVSRACDAIERLLSRI